MDQGEKRTDIDIFEPDSKVSRSTSCSRPTTADLP